MYFARDASTRHIPLYCTPDAKDIQTVFLVVARRGRRVRREQGHQSRHALTPDHAQRVEEPTLRLDRRQRQRSEHLRDIPRRASVPRVGARRPRIASTASRRGRRSRRVGRIDEGPWRLADPRTPSTRHDPRRYMIKFTQHKSSVPNEHPPPTSRPIASTGATSSWTTTSPKNKLTNYAKGGMTTSTGNRQTGHESPLACSARAQSKQHAMWPVSPWTNVAFRASVKQTKSRPGRPRGP